MSKRTEEIRKRLAYPDAEMRTSVLVVLGDLRYLLARAEKLEGLLKRAGDEGNHHTQCNYASPGGCGCGWLAVDMAIDAALGEP